VKLNSPSRFLILVAVAMFITACCCSGPTKKSETPTPNGGGEDWTAEEDITIPQGGGLPNLTIPAGTKITPKSSKGNQEIEEISPSEIGSSLPALPEGKKVIAAVDITPDGMTFSPPVPLEIPLPSGHGYSAGDILEMMQLDKGSDKWLPAGEAEVDASEKFATGEIAHTSVFALVESGPPVPPAARVSVASLLDNLDSLVNINDFEALMVYFPEEIGEEVVNALTAYTEEWGYGGEIIWAALPQGTALEETDYLQGIQTSSGYDPTLYLLIDLSDSDNALLANGAYTRGSSQQAVVKLNTYEDKIILVHSIGIQ